MNKTKSRRDLAIFKKEVWIFAISLVALSCALTQRAGAMSLEEYLASVLEKHRGIKSLDTSREAATARRAQNDLDLSPLLSLSATYLDDKKTGGTPPILLVSHQQVREYNLGLAKKFTTGTQAQVSAFAMGINQDSMSLATNIGSSDQFGLAGLGIAVEQSLWKNGFGSGTRLKRTREALNEKLERETYDLQAQQLLVEAESVYWDLVYLQNELNQRKASLERARKIESWVKQRSSNGIGDRSDVLNAQGLVAGRELQLISTQDELAAAEKKVVDMLELSANETLPELKGDLGQGRSLSANVGGLKSGRTLRLDSYLTVIEAKAKALVAEEVADSMKPDLVLQGAYKTNSFKDSVTGAMGGWTKTETPTASVGLKLTWLLDADSKEGARKAAKMDALAAALKQERKLLESDSAWREMERRNQELTRRIEAAAKINKIQSEKASAERQKLSRGRSITSQVIVAEQDAAEAELTLAKLKAEQRKLEAQGRLFVKVGAQ